MMKHLSLFGLLFFIMCHCYSQETTKVTATGEYCGSSGESFRQIRKTAIENAEENALRNSGIPESVTSSKLLYTSESSMKSGEQDQSQFNQLFTNIASSEIHGKLLINTVLNTNKYVNEFDHLCCEVTIEATVFEYSSERDDAFTFKVEGLQEGGEDDIPNQYSNNTRLSFNFTPNKDGYLKIFDFTVDTALILYPYTNKQYPQLSDEKDRLFQKGESVEFPILSAYKPGYKLSLEKGQNREINHLVFVFTKKDIPFYGQATKKEIFSWIYEIPPSEREVKYFPVMIYRKKD
ncbi:MAG: hypothetical protein ACOCTM_02765 [Bacteroidota bacterium]